MKTLRKISLSNGTILSIEANMLWGFDAMHCPMDFTPAQWKILYKLAINLNYGMSGSRTNNRTLSIPSLI